MIARTFSNDLASRAEDNGKDEIAEQIALLKQVLEADCHDFHTRYLGRRQDLLEICRGEVAVPRQNYRRSLLAASAALATTALYAKLRTASIQ
jgi:hypothetical protein